MPTMIEGYGFFSHVLPRMLPALAFVTFASLAWLVPLRTAGSGRWILLGVVFAVTLAAWFVTSAFTRRMPRFSRPATIAILAAYATMPVAVPLLQLAFDGTITPPGTRTLGLLGFVLFFAAAFAATLLATTYGFGTLLRQAVRHTIYDLRNSVHVLGRALPVLLFATLFLFFTSELWQLMNQLPWWRLALVVALFAAVTVLAAAARLRDETGRVEQDLRPAMLTAACQDTPLAGAPITDGAIRAVTLNGRQKRNLLIMLATRQLMQAVVIGAALFAFFLVLGLIVVTPGVAAQWVTAEPEYSVVFPAVPVALLRNATLLAGFGSMYFAVTSMSDADHRRQFFAPIIDEIERTLAVRAVYLAVRREGRPPRPAPGHTGCPPPAT